jgi:HAE1 family hydrophobic/amphiphilic exporter-1
MWIADYSIRRPVTTIVVMIALVAFGGIALLMLDTDEFPDVNPPIVNLAVAYPGASPITVERELVNPLEEAIAGISGVDSIQSTATDGYAVLTVFFAFDKDVQEASQDIRDKISTIRRALPPEMEEPVITRFDPQDIPIFSLTLSSERLDAAELTRIADPGLISELRGVPGVADVTLVGGIERELTVELRPEALAAVGVGVGQVVQALQSENLATPIGRLTGDLEERTIRLRGRLEGPHDFEQIAVSQQAGKIVRLGEVAVVGDGHEEPRSAALFNGKPAVGIDIKKSHTASTTAVAEALRAKVAELRVPDGVSVDVVRDAGIYVAASVRDVQISLLEGAGLTVLVVFLFLMSWRSTVITGLALPVSVLASFVAVWAFGYTLNTMSLLGLSLAIGILVDDAIVVRENIVRHMEMGKDHVRAAREGTAEIGLAVTATTLCIVVVLVPIGLLGGMVQQWMGPFALTLAASVLVSLFVSFSLDPMLSAKWADPELEVGQRTWLSRRMERFNRWIDRLTVRYRRLVAWALRHRLAMVALAVASFAGAIALPASGVIGSGFLPPQDRSEFELLIETPAGSSLNNTRTRASQIAALAAAMPETRYTYVTVGAQGMGVDGAMVYVRLVPKDERSRSQAEVADAMRAAAARLGGIKASVVVPFTLGKQIQLQLTGPDIAVLGVLAERLARQVEDVPGAVDVGLSSKGQKRELDVVLDRDLAASLGVSLGQVAHALRPAFAGIDAGDWIDPTGATRDVVVRLTPESRTRPEHLESLPLIVPSLRGPVVVPLGQVADVRENLGPMAINHLDRKRVVTVGANVQGAALSTVVGSIEARLEDLRLPDGYQLAMGGETQDQQEVFVRMIVAMLTGIMLMYLILVIQFRSFLDPIPIMASLPLSLIGVMLGLLFTGSTINLMSMIGIVLLMGIVAKNAILLIDFAKEAQRQGMDRKSAIVEAGAVRLRPILMTSLAVIAGMLPIAIGGGEGGDFRAPLGRAVIGGVITSTALTLVAIPTFYDILASWREWLGRRLKRRPLAPPPY